MTPDEFQSHVIDALARLDVKVGSLVGNGQPGRVTMLETSVDELKKTRWVWGGAIIGGGGVLSTLLHVLWK